MPDNKNKSIDSVTVKSDDSFTKQILEAQKKIRENTGYKGQFKPEEIDKFFEIYKILPVGNNQFTTGLTIEYKLRPAEKKGQPLGEKVAGSGPKSFVYDIE